MARILTVAAAQLGPIARGEPRSAVIARMIGLMETAHKKGAQLIVYPELALTTFFPRWWMADGAEVDQFFERTMPSPETQPLFEAAKRLGCGFHLGYAELTDAGEHFNTAILVGTDGQILGKYRKVHLPGHADNQPWRPFQHLEKRYFLPGQGGFPAFDAFGAKIGIAICNDRRWPETYRVLSLNGAEVILIGYNTPRHYPPVPDHDHLQDFHNHLVMQAGAYQNGAWIIGVAKAGMEEGCDLIGGSCIINPIGEIEMQATAVGDEVLVRAIDVDRVQEIRKHIFDFQQHRRPDAYGPLTA